MKVNLIVLFLFITCCSFSQSTAGNLDFEDGDLTNWTTEIGNVSAPFGTPHPFTLDSAGIVDSGVYMTASHNLEMNPWFDSSLLYIPVMCPFTNSNTMRLGSYYRTATSRMHTFLNVTAADTLLDFFYSYIGFSAAHPPHKNPYFYFEILDSSAGSLTLLDSIYIQSDSAVLIPDTGTTNLSYTGWKHVSFNLSSYVGQKIMIRIANAKCGYGSHLGRLYFDFSADSKLIINNLTVCKGDSTLFRGNYFKNDGIFYDTVFVGSVVDSVFVTNVTVYNKNIIMPVLANYSLTGCSNKLVTINCNVLSTGADSTKFNWFVNGVSTLSTPNFSSYLSSGTQSIYCEVTNYENGCVRTELSDTVVVNITTAPSVNLTLIGADVKANVTGGTSPYVYKWYRNTIVQTSTSSLITPIISGNYNVVVTDSNGCIGKDTLLNYGVSLDEYKVGFDFNFYPNPATNSVYLELNGEKGTIEIIDVQGKLVQSTEVKSNGELKLENLKKGIYLLKFKMESNKIITKKLVVE